MQLLKQLYEILIRSKELQLKVVKGKIGQLTYFRKEKGPFSIDRKNSSGPSGDSFLLKKTPQVPDESFSIEFLRTQLRVVSI